MGIYLGLLLGLAFPLLSQEAPLEERRGTPQVRQGDYRHGWSNNHWQRGHWHGGRWNRWDTHHGHEGQWYWRHGRSYQRSWEKGLYRGQRHWNHHHWSNRHWNPRNWNNRHWSQWFRGAERWNGGPVYLKRTVIRVERELPPVVGVTREQLCGAVTSGKRVELEVASKYEGREWILVEPLSVGTGKNGAAVLLVNQMSLDGGEAVVKTLDLHDIYAWRPTEEEVSGSVSLRQALMEHLESWSCPLGGEKEGKGFP